MATAPIITWNLSVAPYSLVSSQAMTGAGYNGAVVIGESSNPYIIRLYNNQQGLAGVADATNCTLAVYDDTIHSGAATGPATLGLYVQVQILDYNGNTTGADTFAYGIGGSTKHVIPTNNGVISGAGANYVTVQIQIVVPSNATQQTISQGLWLEYSSSA